MNVVGEVYDSLQLQAPAPLHGHVPGVALGARFPSRAALQLVNVHARPMDGIHAP